MNKVTIELLVRDYGRMIGLARYTTSLLSAFEHLGVAARPVPVTVPWTVRLAQPVLARFGWDLKTFLSTYPVQANLSRGALKHLTTQQMASLLWLNPRLHPVVVTVHDVVPYLVQGDARQDTSRHPIDRYFERQSMRALKRADGLISVSEFTKKMLVEHLGCQAEKIFVVLEGVNHDLFRPLPVPDAFLQRYGLDRQGVYLLYVGSDNPHKNLPRLIEAFARVYQAMPGVRLIKVGTSENPELARQHRAALTRSGLDGATRWLEQVPENDLPFFYNLARVFVFPSLYEGFGLPPLEAMACGTPVVCSNAASLPEVAGEAALQVDPLDVEGMAEAVMRILGDPTLASDVRARGLAQASRFTWELTARETLKVYEMVRG